MINNFKIILINMFGFCNIENINYIIIFEYNSSSRV